MTTIPVNPAPVVRRVASSVSNSKAVPKKNCGPVKGSSKVMRSEITSALRKKKTPAARLRPDRTQSRIRGVSPEFGEGPMTGKRSVKIPETNKIPRTSGSEITNKFA